MKSTPAISFRKHFIKFLLYLCTFFLLFPSAAQTFTKYDTLRGTLNPMRTCYDVYFYNLDLDIDIPNKSIKGSNEIFFKAAENFQKLQVDLFTFMKIDSIVSGNKKLSYTRDSNVVYIEFIAPQLKAEKNSIRIFYSGIPWVARNPPWDGGFIWSKDSLGRPWVGVACEGLGASSWWPCKDHFSDEPDSMRMTFRVPSELSCISNGNLIRKQELPGKKTAFTWLVSYPINTYNATLNIGHYTSFQDLHKQSSGTTLNLDYYVLDYHLPIAKKHFQQVKKMLKAYENYFGPYPFPKDGYALIETHYWGMEHQSAVSYGNTYENKLGDFDFIIVHESAHEWWGNSLTANDIGELWIHESFATYSEALLMEYFYGYKNSLAYLLHQSPLIKNKSPLLKPMGVNYFYSKDADIYYKGSWMLHTIRNVVNNDSLWFKMIYGLADRYKHSIVTTDTVVRYFNAQSGIDLSPLFDQYLRFPQPPGLIYEIIRKGKKYELYYQWKTDVPNFKMPVSVELKNGKILRLQPTADLQKHILSKEEATNFRIMTELFYITTENKSKKD